MIILFINVRIKIINQKKSLKFTTFTNLKQNSLSELFSDQLQITRIDSCSTLAMESWVALQWFLQVLT